MVELNGGGAALAEDVQIGLVELGVGLLNVDITLLAPDLVSFQLGGGPLVLEYLCRGVKSESYVVLSTHTHTTV